nr:hypothetical protein OG284_36535 [Streptomyces sp. NBC_01177]
MLSVVNEDGTTEAGSLIDEIVREGARRMLAAALGSVVKCHVRIRGSNYELPSHAVRSAAIGIVIATWHHDRHE